MFILWSFLVDTFELFEIKNEELAESVKSDVIMNMNGSLNDVMSNE